MKQINDSPKKLNRNTIKVNLLSSDWMKMATNLYFLFIKERERVIPVTKTLATIKLCKDTNFTTL